jgi:hypothetical protein
MQLRRRDQRTLTEQLLYVEDRITLCRKHVERLNALIAEEIARGGDPAQSRKLLRQITDLLSKNILERDRLQRELGELLK